MKYLIRHKELLCKTFIVEADDDQAALDQFKERLDAGKVDLSDMEVLDTEDTAAACPNFKTACEWK